MMLATLGFQCLQYISSELAEPKDEDIVCGGHGDGEPAALLSFLTQSLLKPHAAGILLLHVGFGG